MCSKFRQEAAALVSIMLLLLLLLLRTNKLFQMIFGINDGPVMIRVCHTYVIYVCVQLNISVHLPNTKLLELLTFNDVFIKNITFAWQQI